MAHAGYHTRTRLCSKSVVHGLHLRLSGPEDGANEVTTNGALPPWSTDWLPATWSRRPPLSTKGKQPSDAPSARAGRTRPAALRRRNRLEQLKDPPQGLVAVNTDQVPPPDGARRYVDTLPPTSMNVHECSHRKSDRTRMLMPSVDRFLIIG